MFTKRVEKCPSTYVLATGRTIRIMRTETGVNTRERTRSPRISLEAKGSEARALCNINTRGAEDAEETAGRAAEKVKGTKPGKRERLC